MCDTPDNVFSASAPKINTKGAKAYYSGLDFKYRDKFLTMQKEYILYVEQSKIEVEMRERVFEE